MQTDTFDTANANATTSSPTTSQSANTQAIAHANNLAPSLTATAPGQLKVIKRNGTVVPYTDDKIAVAMTKAFLAVEGGTAAASPRIRELVAELMAQVSGTFSRRLPSGGTLHIEDVQDQVELALMRSGEHKVARSYVLYRAERARLREESERVAVAPEHANLHVINEAGNREPLDIGRIHTLVFEACEGLDDVNAEHIMTQALNNMYDGISSTDVATSLLITARTMVEDEPNYTYVTSRLLLDELRREALTFLDLQKPGAASGDYRATQGEMSQLYPNALVKFLQAGSSLELVSPELLEFDLQRLGAAIKPERDLLFTYCLLYTSPSPRDLSTSRMPSSA